MVLRRSTKGKGKGGKGGEHDETIVVPRCACDPPRRARVKRAQRDGPNQGREYYACGLAAARGVFPPPKPCEFFAWADDAPSKKSSVETEWRRFDAPRFRRGL